ncbi:TetR/AcrR family transcriptional regulator C-terminal domain-containing protein [Kineosporia sp. A_224]|uniref:TetR/AcrR family transcriptional regulator C-terminal domain-containing protein n=1 Tax=Kineosporia sp. A_224 TaxID=1962180 RepID=UPI000B4B0B08|nr:TetR/AcrR family transcriptional regulator C-terminal domain-containing protein [Kineosporia sp. A_224]
MAARAFRQPLSRELLLATAVALVNVGGIKALTMRRLATAVGVEPMSLYYHLPDKEALLDGVVETVVAEILAAVDDLGPHGADQWRARLRRQFLAAREVMLRHPWAPGLLGSRETIPVGLYPYFDGIVGTLVGAGFSYRLAHRALHTLGSMSLGFTQEIFSPAPAADGVQGDQAEADLAAMAEALPHLSAMVASEIHDPSDPVLGWCDSQVEFEFTLDLILSGLERLKE